MDLEAFGRSPCGQLVPVSGTDPRSGASWNYFAFIPAPLPHEPSLSLEAINAATQAAMMVARLDQAASQLPNPSLLVRPTIRREAVSTASLEGTYAAYDEVLEADFLSENQLSSEQREVRNYIYASEHAIELLEKYPISRNMLGKLQKMIVRGTHDDSPEAGDLRQHLVCVGPEGRPIEEARFVPPPPGDVLADGIGDWEKWVNADNKVPIIVKMALAHYQFETLHPYNNGNGRLGRLVAILQLIVDGVLKYPIINLSPHLDRYRDEYIDHLVQITISGDFNPWVLFFSGSIRSQAAEGIAIIDGLISFKDRTVQELRQAGLRGAILELIEILIGYPVIDVPTVKARLDRSFETANQVVSRLVERGVLREITGRKMNRLFICDEVMHLTSLPTRRRHR